MTRLRICAALLFAMLSACSEERAQPPTFHASENPRALSEWGMVAAQNGAFFLSEGVTPYDLATPLFTDYALKLRTVWMPEGTAAQYHADRTFDFPVGTVFTKTFYYQQETPDWTGAVMQSDDSPPLIDRRMALSGLRLIETRILVRRDAGWTALPYIWNEEQTDAFLKRTGDIAPMTLARKDGRREDFPYVVPNANQCAGCHAPNATSKAILPIGLKARHLNKPSSFVAGFNQLDHWIAAGILAGDFADAENAPRNAAWGDESESLDKRARSYLDVNCSHCHNAVGPADTSGLGYEPDTPYGPALGVFKTPVAAGGGTGGRPFDITPGDPDASIMVFRMETDDPGAMMPELGRAVAHEEGVDLIKAWILEMNGASAGG